MAAAGDMQYKSQLEQIVMRHRRTVDEVVDPACRAEVLATVNTLLDELSNLFKGVYLIKDLSPKTSDAIVSYGERLFVGDRAGGTRMRNCTTPVNLSRPGPISGNISSNSHRPKS